MLVYLVRHGESEGNKLRFHQVEETPLSKKGIKQAEVLAERLKNTKIDVIYSSKITRAKQTAEIISKKLNIPIEYWDNLVEMRTPTEIRGKSIDDPEVIKIKKLIEKKLDNGNWKYSNEETFNELNKRVKKLIKHLEDNHNDQNILCISHSTLIKALTAKIIFGQELTIDIFEKIRKSLWMENTSISVFEKSKEYGWTLVTWSDRSHLYNF
ncbi:MAG: histidine phosphatase family protein [Candidatus Woesebacteria bacterium]|nr:histidine phosphatase family protein [Candidatus Woesebacteria bacterium]